ncbi:CrcB protein [Nakamurella panacisegetis]|uniref:Fluoride-specific ion channel FluC n=1 Tax=Nakamurella panacisegetis TaxID=1090615 RepID=A0A1H0QU00_9ACTN|nr:fluoride efflux transporter CrcB [Nakamurella panacisegetis]SDP20772.1 CrcB protein [Nakamurella panacisegetis]
MTDHPGPWARPEPIDPDVDLAFADQRRELHGHHPVVLGAIAAGGVIGALLRYQVGLWWPSAAGHFPVATLTINLVGCLVIGVFMVVIHEVVTPHQLLRPFFGTGLLGGFTTFSTYSLDITNLLREGRGGTALAYLAITAAGAVLAVSGGMFLTRRIASGVRA